MLANNGLCVGHTVSLDFFLPYAYAYDKHTKLFHSNFVAAFRIHVTKASLLLFLSVSLKS